jgi:hypothetical protein
MRRWLFLTVLVPTLSAETARVAAIHHSLLFRYVEIIAAGDPSCVLTYREFRDPFNPLSITAGSTTTITDHGNSLTMIDEKGHRHHVSLASQSLMPPIPIAK